MNIMENWFNECSKVFNCGEFRFVISNGFKITHYFEGNIYTIQDTRMNDFYTSVSEEDMKIIMDYGFVNGTGIIMYHRNVRRVEYYLDKIKFTFEKKKRAKKRLNSDKKFFSKQIKNCDINIHNYNDLVHFYKSKVEQFEPKFKQLTQTINNYE